LGETDMKLIKFRIRGLTGMVDSGWQDLGAGATLLGPRPGGGPVVALTALQHINPLKGASGRQGFADPLTYVSRGGYARKVNPGKKTAAIAVFASDPLLVHELSEIDPDLMETDRIEVGRRLDYSRWLNFVEISSSGRWSEIVTPMLALRHYLDEKLPAQPSHPADSLLADLRAVDRITGNVADILKDWLRQAETVVDEKHLVQIASCRQVVERHERFARARRLVEDRLPPFVLLHPDQGLRQHFALDDLAPAGNAGEKEGLVDHLLARLWQKTAKAGSVAERQLRLRQDLAASAENLASLAADTGLALPRFRLTEGAVEIGQAGLSGPAAARMTHLYSVLLLCQAVHGWLPVLLLADFEKDLSRPEQVNLFERIREIGMSCQVAYAPASDHAADWDGWAGKLHLDAL
jgi:hypothetical protein